MNRFPIPASLCLAAALALAAASPARADDVTTMVERDLAILGYSVGDVDGNATTETIVAISQFQAENGMPVTGEASPQLAGILAAKVANPGGAPPAASAAQAAPAAQQDPAALKAAQQACLQEKAAQAQAAQKKKKGFGSLFKAVNRIAVKTGNSDLAQATYDVYDANATASDLAQAAEDLGLTQEDIEACKNPA